MTTQTRAAAATGKKRTVINPQRRVWRIPSFDPPVLTSKDVADYLRGVFAPDTRGESSADKIKDEG